MPVRFTHTKNQRDLSNVEWEVRHEVKRGSKRAILAEEMKELMDK